MKIIYKKKRYILLYRAKKFGEEWEIYESN